MSFINYQCPASFESTESKRKFVMVLFVVVLEGFHFKVLFSGADVWSKQYRRVDLTLPVVGAADIISRKLNTQIGPACEVVHDA